jgi:hypothetical protein
MIGSKHVVMVTRARDMMVEIAQVVPEARIDMAEIIRFKKRGYIQAALRCEKCDQGIDEY